MKMQKIIAVTFLALFLIPIVYMSPMLRGNSDEESTQIDNAMSLNQEETGGNAASAYPSELVEEIKSRILKSLHMKEAPKRHVLLPTLQTLNFMNEPERNKTIGTSEDGETKTDFLLAEIDNSTSLGDDGYLGVRMHFNLSLQPQYEGAELWLYKNQDITEFTITQSISIDGNEHKQKSSISVYNQTAAKGWIRFDVTNILSMENTTSLTVQVLRENNKDCLELEDDKKPFLLMHTLASLKSVSKRSVSDCSNDSSSCCKQKYYINFKDINWSDWIVQPEGYEANFCKGTCSNADGLSGPDTHHARVFMALCETNPQKLREIGKRECLSCAPTAYRSVSIIYLDDDGVQVVSHLPGMSVTECGCV